MSPPDVPCYRCWLRPRGRTVLAAQHPLRPLPPLNALKAFEAVGRLGSVRRAAEALTVSHTVVGRHVRNLEDWVGVKLVHTGPHGTELTPEGRRLLDSVSVAFESIASAIDMVRPGARRGELRLWCVPGLAVRWLMPRLSQLQAALRETEVVLRPTDSAPDFSKHEADIEIRFGQRMATGVRSEELVLPRFFPVASPTFLATCPPIGAIADLAGLPLIHEESREQWRSWLDLAGVTCHLPLQGPRVWYANVATDAAIMGQGVALTNRYLAASEVASGRLVEVLDTDIRIGGYFFHTASDRWNDPDIARVRRWLAQALAE